jgi:hypothetical protein
LTCGFPFLQAPSTRIGHGLPSTAAPRQRLRPTSEVTPPDPITATRTAAPSSTTGRAGARQANENRGLSDHDSDEFHSPGRHRRGASSETVVGDPIHAHLVLLENP